MAEPPYREPTNNINVQNLYVYNNPQNLNHCYLDQTNVGQNLGNQATGTGVQQQVGGSNQQRDYPNQAQSALSYYNPLQFRHYEQNTGSECFDLEQQAQQTPSNPTTHAFQGNIQCNC